MYVYVCVGGGLIRELDRAAKSNPPAVSATSGVFEGAAQIFLLITEPVTFLLRNYFIFSPSLKSFLQFGL